jgi:hypothetical protein
MAQAMPLSLKEALGFEAVILEIKIPAHNFPELLFAFTTGVWPSPRYTILSSWYYGAMNS